MICPIHHVPAYIYEVTTAGSWLLICAAGHTIEQRFVSARSTVATPVSSTNTTSNANV